MYKSESLLKKSPDLEMITWLSNLLHESTHMVLYNLYANTWRPFSSTDQFSEQKFIKIKDELSKQNPPYSNYAREDHIPELPAFLSNALIRDMFKDAYLTQDNTRFNLLLNHTSLREYMDKVYRTADLDSTAIETVSGIFADKSKTDQALQTPGSGNEDPSEIIMGYLRGGYHDNLNDAIYNAIEQNNLPRLQKVIETPNYKDSHVTKDTLLYAIQNNNLEILEIVLKKTPDEVKFEVLGCESNLSLEKRKIILDSFKDVNAQYGEKQETLLHKALSAKKIDAAWVKELLEAGADPTVKNQEGKSAADLARVLNKGGKIDKKLYLKILASNLDKSISAKTSQPGNAPPKPGSRGSSPSGRRVD